MKNNFLLVCCCALLFASCTKDNTTTPINPPADSTAVTIIVDSFFNSGSFTGVDSTKFFYDNGGQLDQWTYIYSASTYMIHEDNFCTRDSKGRVTTVTRKGIYTDNGVAEPQGSDAITKFYYVPGSDDLSYFLTYTIDRGPGNGDSVAVSYTGKNITDQRTYDLSASDPLSSLNETSWTFDDAGQMQTCITEVQDSTSRAYYTFTFDGKVNPLKLGAEGLIIDNLRRSGGNLVNQHLVFPIESIDDQGMFSYTYRSDNRPVRATFSHSSGADTRTTLWFYSR